MSAPNLSSESAARRANKPGKPTPRLPLSAFSPPNSGAGERFPLPSSPGTIHPTSVLDGGVTISSIDDLGGYLSSAKTVHDERLKGLVISLPVEGLEGLEQKLTDSSAPILAVSVPLSASTTAASIGKVRLVRNTIFTGSDQELTQSIKSALSTGVVEIDVQTDLTTSAGWEALEEILTAILDGAEPDATKPAIVLSNILPPPKGLELPTVTLLNHPSYQEYQGRIATLSFFKPIYVRFGPPQWGPVPGSLDAEGVTSKEWQKRIRMYLGPIIEAFGFNRIIYASSGLSSTVPSSSPQNWYEIARETVAELGVDQESIDAIFGGNAKALYGQA